jgi:hypothetical protein
MTPFGQQLKASSLVLAACHGLSLTSLLLNFLRITQASLAPCPAPLNEEPELPVAARLHSTVRPIGLPDEILALPTQVAQDCSMYVVLSSPLEAYPCASQPGGCVHKRCRPSAWPPSDGLRSPVRLAKAPYHKKHHGIGHHPCRLHCSGAKTCTSCCPMRLATSSQSAGGTALNSVYAESSQPHFENKSFSSSTP